MEEAITALLLASPQLKQLVSNRVHWDLAPQGVARPYIILQLVSDVPNQTNEGRSGFEQSRLQIDAYAEQVAQAKAIVSAAAGVLEKTKGNHAGIFLQGAIIDQRRSLPAVTYTAQQPVFRRSADMIIWHS